MSRILLGITGSIAAYKAINIAKSLIGQQHIVDIVLTKSAEKFVSILTLKSLFPNHVYRYNDAISSEDKIIHIELAKLADCILIAPASANVIAKLANGFADCLLLEICLASKSPLFIAPAMNKVMWENKFVQANIDHLSSNGIHIINPGFGIQACGDIGIGRLAEVNQIVEHINSIRYIKILDKVNIVITCGPTREKLDPVRFISSYSSGKMGYALAEIAAQMGACVTLISGPTQLPLKNNDIKLIEIESAEEMLNAVEQHLKNADIFIGAAAVADFKPSSYSNQKIKKNKSILRLDLDMNEDIISYVKSKYPNIFCVGFAAQTDNIIQEGKDKLHRKNLDMIAINDVSQGKVFNSEDNEIHLLLKNGYNIHLKKANKKIIAEQMLQIIRETFYAIRN